MPAWSRRKERERTAARLAACALLLLASACSRPAAPVAAKKPPGIVWGPKRADGLQAGLSLSAYEIDCREPITVTTHLRNTSARDIKFSGKEEFGHPWFRPKHGKAYLLFDLNELIGIRSVTPWVLKAGKSVQSSLTSGGRVMFTDKATKDCRFHLPPGEYAVSAHFAGLPTGTYRLIVAPIPTEEVRAGSAGR
ncbi:MAG: hypothetical protein ACYTGB_07780 [Planctomycetota bacterium]|jgi:hypothetical protein